MPYLKRLMIFVLLFIAACSGGNGANPDSTRGNVAAAQTSDDGPVVEILSPDAGADVLVNTEVVIYAFAEDSVGVTRLELREGGTVLKTLYTPEPAGATQFAVLFSWVPRIAGEKVVEVIAYRSGLASQPAQVALNVRTSETEVAAPAAAPTFVVPVNPDNRICRVRINIDALHLYDQAALGSELVVSLPIGAEASVAGRTPDNAWWSIVTPEGERGWVQAEYTTLLGNCGGVAVTGEAAPGTQNLPPVIGPIPTQTVAVGQRLNVPVSASDPEGSAVSVASVESGSEDIVLVERAPNNEVVIQGVSPGQVSVRVTVEDGQGFTAAAIFTVVVQGGQPQGNQPPVVQPISNQRVTVGDLLVVQVVATDPEGFNPFTASAESGSDEIAAVEIDDEGNLLIRGVSAGQVSIRVTVDDSQGSLANVLFNVTVVEPSTEPDQPPVVQPIADVTLAVGQEVSIPVQATDPEGFNVTMASISSASDQIVSAAPGDFNQVVLKGISPGTSVITITMEDGTGMQTTITFMVTVPVPPTEAPDQPPTLDPIPDQAVRVGQEITVFFNAVDPEGFNTFVSSLESSADSIVAVEIGSFGRVFITGVSPGTATVSITVDDSHGGTATQTFNVTVTEAPPEPGGNLAPMIEPIASQTLNFDEFLPLPISASDPEGEAVSLRVTSSDETVAPAQVTGDGSVTIYGASAGTATITITAADPQNNAASIVFEVTVTGGDIPPALPQVSDALLQNMQAIYGAGVQAASYSVIGDAAPESLPIGGEIDISAMPDLQAVVETFAGGAAASNPAWITADLLDPANNPAGCENAVHPVDCAVMTEQPSIAILITGRNDVLAGTPPETFAADLTRVVDELMARNVIPVLVTIPGDPAQVGAYNDVIIALAAQRTLPLWNLTRSIPVEQVNAADLSLTSPGAGQDAMLTPQNVNAYGTSQRNLKLLQLLKILGDALGIR